MIAGFEYGFGASGFWLLLSVGLGLFGFGACLATVCWVVLRCGFCSLIYELCAWISICFSVLWVCLCLFVFVCVCLLAVCLFVLNLGGFAVFRGC